MYINYNRKMGRPPWTSFTCDVNTTYYAPKIAIDEILGHKNKAGGSTTYLLTLSSMEVHHAHIIYIEMCNIREVWTLAGPVASQRDYPDQNYRD